MTTHPLQEAIKELQNTDRVSIKGKQYTMVAQRVEIFRKYFPPPAYGIQTSLIGIEDPFVRIKAEITHLSASKETGELVVAVVASGIAEENRSQGAINRTSAVENAETSAIGRALAAFGLHGGDYASAEEVGNAVAIQEDGKAKQKEGEADFVKTNLKARSHEIVSDIHACTDMSMLIALWEAKETKAFLKNAKSHYPEGVEAVTQAKDERKLQIETDASAFEKMKTTLGAG